VTPFYPEVKYQVVLDMRLLIERLNTRVHARNTFHNTDPSIEDFLRLRANKEHELNISDTFVLVYANKKEEILGYYTLSSSSVIVSEIPHEYRKRIPYYPNIGTILLGRMGRNQYLTQSGFGLIIMKEAMKTALTRGTFFALELHAKNEKLISYYKQFGFVSLEDCKHMILPYQILKQVTTSSS
jgi:predicted GNAT family N-acyltransferase